MNMKKKALACSLILIVFLSGCRDRLPDYSESLVLRIYGQGELKNEELSAIDEVVSQYADCLFNVEDSTMNNKRLTEIAPYEDPEEWAAVYEKNKTQSVLKAYQILDIDMADTINVNCLCVCEADYSDWKTPEDTYLFIVEVAITSENGTWQVVSSELLGAARKDDTVIQRDDLTNQIKFVGKGGEEK